MGKEPTENLLKKIDLIDEFEWNNNGRYVKYFKDENLIKNSEAAKTFMDDFLKRLEAVKSLA